MNNRILLITHENIGTALLKTARYTYGKLPIPTRVIAVNYLNNPTNIINKLEAIASNTKRDEGLLILTDMYGSTPCNIALALQHHRHLRIVSGLNLPMLIKVLNYPQMPLHKLAQKALQGGRGGVVNCSREYRKLYEEAS